jgi:hypothetical protein
VAEGGPEEPVQGGRGWPRPFAFEHGDLLSEGEDFEGRIGSTAEEDTDHGEDGATRPGIPTIRIEGLDSDTGAIAVCIMPTRVALAAALTILLCATCLAGDLVPSKHSVISNCV